MTASIHHVQVAIPAGGEDDARRFYGGLLGLKEVTKPEYLAKRGGIWFQTGSLQLHLGVDQNFVPAKKAHVAFEVKDLMQMRTRLADADLVIVEDEPIPEYDRFYVSDPFGNRVEILASIR